MHILSYNHIYTLTASHHHSSHCLTPPPLHSSTPGPSQHTPPHHDTPAILPPHHHFLPLHFTPYNYSYKNPYFCKSENSVVNCVINLITHHYIAYFELQLILWYISSMDFSPQRCLYSGGSYNGAQRFPASQLAFLHLLCCSSHAQECFSLAKLLYICLATQGSSWNTVIIDSYSG